MNYGELKQEIVSLGFEDNEILDEYNNLIIDSVNRAIDIINEVARPIVKKVSLTIDEEAPKVYDLMLLAEDFVDFYGNPIITNNGRREVFTDYRVEGKTIINLPEDFIGDLDVYYKAYPTRITDETPDDFEIELDRLVQPLIALLASYFIWLDDDERKATMYFNQYDQQKDLILAINKEPAKATFVGGRLWHR